jgi:hypothetical protein
VLQFVLGQTNTTELSDMVSIHCKIAVVSAPLCNSVSTPQNRTTVRWELFHAKLRCEPYLALPHFATTIIRF